MHLYFEDSVGEQASEHMTFTVTARERYVWTLEIKRRGRNVVRVLRDVMEERVERQS